VANDAQAAGDIRVPAKWVITALGTIIIASGSVLVDIFIFDDADALDRLAEEVSDIQFLVADIIRDDLECEEHQRETDARTAVLSKRLATLHDKVYEFQPEIRATIIGMKDAINDCIRRTQ